MSETTQVYSIYIDASAQDIWNAITQSKYTVDWGYGGEVEYDMRPGGRYTNFTTPDMKAMGMGDVAVSGTVVEVQEPTKLVLDWAPAWHADWQPTRLTWELTEYPASGLTKVTLTHDVSKAPELGPEVAGGGDPIQGGGGWPWCLSGLKTLVESGRAMASKAG